MVGDFWDIGNEVVVMARRVFDPGHSIKVRRNGGGSMTK